MPRLHDAAAWRHHGMGGLIADSHCSRRSHDSSRILRADSEWNRIQHGHVAASLAIASGSKLYSLHHWPFAMHSYMHRITRLVRRFWADLF